MRYHFPNVDDTHLYSLENDVLTIIKTNNMCIKTLMGNDSECIIFKKITSRNSSPQRQIDNVDNLQRVDTFQYAARIPEKNLRCLNI